MKLRYAAALTALLTAVSPAAAQFNSPPLFVPPGTAAQPSYSFGTDHGTGFFFPGGGQVGFASAGVDSGFRLGPNGFGSLSPCFTSPSGVLTLVCDPQAPNIIQNGDFLVDQPNEGASVTITTGTSPRSVDRFFANFVVSTSGAGNPTIQQVALSSGLLGTLKELKVTANSTPGTTVPAALTGQIFQSVEGADVQDIGFGATGASSLTVSVWLKSSIASAVFDVAVQNAAASRAYAHDCTLGTASTWGQCTFTIPGDVTGTYTLTQGAVGLKFFIVYACGSTFQQTNNAWAATNTYCTANQTQLTNTASATLEIAQFKVERGAVFSGFLVQSEAQTLSRVRRYYQKSFVIGTAPAQNAGLAGSGCTRNPVASGDPALFVNFQPPLYASPTITTFNPSAANANFRDVTAAADSAVTVDAPSAKGTNGVIMAPAQVTTLGDYLCIHWTADAGI